MHRLQRLTEEIRSLSSGELAALRTWFEHFDGVDADRQIDAYLSAETAPDAATVSPGENTGSAADQAMLEMAAGMREAYRQVAFQEYAQFVAADLGLATVVSAQLE